MNNPHQNARMTRLGRAEMIRRILEDGQPVREIARGFGMSERTARKWLARFKAEGPSGLENRSSCPRSVANRTAESWIGVIEMLRREYRLTAEEIAASSPSPAPPWRLGSPGADWGACSLGAEGATPARSAPAPWRADHLDIKKLACFERVGHRITGDRRNPSTGAGHDCFHVAIDDATRLAYVEVLPDETRRSTTAFLVRALRWFRARGIRVERVMTDNGSGYIARLFRKALRMLGIRHIRTRPYTPKTNGKAERFIQTLLREWAYAIPFNFSDARAADLPRWLTWYNQQRPHGSLHRRTPAQALAGIT